MLHGRLSLVAPIGLAFVLSVGFDVGKVAGQGRFSPPNNADDDKRLGKLLPVPKIKLARPTPATKAEAKEIQALIDSLPQIEDADDGRGYLYWEGFPQLDPMSPFSPLDRERWSVAGQPAPCPSIKKLVEFGPKALSFLLDYIDDSSPTRLIVTLPEPCNTVNGHEFSLQTVLCHDIDLNPFNPTETAATNWPNRMGNEEIGNDHLILTIPIFVGDISFIAIGQITNRRYFAAKTVEHTIALKDGSVMVARRFGISKPVEDGNLTDAIRDIWGDTDHDQKLLDSLLIDFHIRGQGSDRFQAGAAMRLAYYFPKETSKLIAERLKQLDVTTDDDAERREINGVVAADLISSVSWSTAPQIATAVLDIFKKTTIEDIFLACLPGIGKEHDEEGLQRLINFLNVRRDSGSGERGHYQALLWIGERFPERAKDVFAKYLSTKRSRNRQDMCFLLRRTCQPWSIDLLTPLLSKKTKLEEASDSEFFQPPFVRLCDLAAQTIALNFPNLEFAANSDVVDMDAQIDVMKRKIEERKNGEK